MGEWFRKAFGHDYSEIYSHRDASEAGRAVAMIISKAGLASGSLVLDAPCGAGRHLQAFKAAGMRAVGFDLSLPLLYEAVANSGLSGKVLRADLRSLPFAPRTCDMVVNLFSSLGYFDTDAQNLSVLAELAALVKPDGWMVIDFMNSAYVEKNLQAESQRETASGIKVHDTRWLSGNPMRVNKETRLIYPDGHTDDLMESVRLFTPADLRAALIGAGIEIRHELGSYDGEPFSDQSSRIILMGRKL